MSFAIAGCAFLRPFRSAGSRILPPYSGAKARIAVADFEIKTAKATSEIGTGLREMLINALIDSNRFSIVQGQASDAVVKEQGAAVSEGKEQPAEIKQDKAKEADLVIIAALSEFESQASGGRAGVGGGGDASSGVLGGLSGDTLNKAHLALDLRLIDTASSKVIASSRIQGLASDTNGAVMTVSLGRLGLASQLSAYTDTPMEKAIYICIIEATKYIAKEIPPDYYKY